MEIIAELRTVLQARYSLIYAVAKDEEIAEETLIEATEKKRQIYFWDFSRGWSDSGKDKGNPMQALNRVASAPPEQATLFVMKDLANVIAPLNGKLTMAQIPIVREIKNLAREMSRDRRCLILLNHDVLLPKELEEEALIIDFSLPILNEIHQIIDTLVGKKIKLSPEDRERLGKACQGLTRIRIQRVLAKSLVKHHSITPAVIDEVIDEKRSTIRKTEILEFINCDRGLESVGGLDNLKLWVRSRSGSFSEKARDYGLPMPKGVLLAGIQGTGKSLAAKTIAHEWKLPLLRLDVGRLFGGIVGESESRTRQAIQIAEAISPCVLMLDEAEKAFSSGGGEGDSGTSKRVFGTFLTWMQEKTAPVFIVVTANNVELLPPEFLRKGRLNEIFWVDLPSHEDRKSIFNVHLTRLRSDRQFDLDLLASRSKDFSGAEIEQAIYDGMQFGFSRDEEFTETDLLNAIASTVPLQQIASDKIQHLRDWASKSGARSASFSQQSTQQLQDYRIEVDCD
ncbi:AAA family ATPase [Laspinema palackyanum]|uniref:AAA family ATPase n=1 Tax=Laspinema palackyanum TaxID=3231601 RepID=UPI00345CFA77|nr:AAA family ATPase [Laspinema sp. D2c]